MFRKLFFRIKRYFYYKCCGFYPEDICNLLYVQKYLEKKQREYKKYQDSIKEHFNVEQK